MEIVAPRFKGLVYQFSKYFVFGIGATLVHQVFFVITGFTIFPHFDSLVESLGLSLNQVAVNFCLSSFVGFVFGDVFAYYTNAKWVFKERRYGFWKSFGIFTAFASVGFVIGLVLSVAALKYEFANTWGANLVLVITSVIVNFLCRKFFVFKG